MTKTRKALLNSIIALVLCFSMLLGTTWAWFTDSVTSSNNIIQSGVLKAGMEYSDDLSGDSWQDASTGSIFDYQHWEPGFTQIKYIKVKTRVIWPLSIC
jgi:predicted ribosomally synthesized peptide with SipW-like signal peptide